MIQEDYVNFETAKLLKEKGFDEKCRQYYYNDNLILSRSGICNEELHNYKEVEEGWSAPTLQMAMKWLREVHRLHCNIGYDNVNWYWDIQTVRKPVTEETAPKMLPAIATIGLTYSTYEEACEAAIKYCLENLI